MDGSSLLTNVQLVGSALMRGVTLTLPTRRVEELLPTGMRLRGQDLTPPGTHPLVLFFYHIFRAHMTIPTPMPDLTYYEQIVGVPFVDVVGDFPNPVPGGPFFFMPQLLLTDYLATLGGRLYWGFAKDLAQITETERSYEVRGLDGRPLIKLELEHTGDAKPVRDYPHFERMQKVLDQPLVSQVPLGVGPYFVASDFSKVWSSARMRPMTTVVHIAEEFVPGLPTGRFPIHGRAPGIDVDVLGSYEFVTDWTQSLIYPTWFPTR
jgi:hypothetical protein